MSGEESNFTVWGFLKGFGKLLIGLLLLVQGIIGLVLLLLVVGVLVNFSANFTGPGKQAAVAVPEGAALLLNPRGVLVEQTETVDPFEKALQEAYGVSEPAQVSVHDIVRVIRKAKDDERIKAMVLDVGGLAAPFSSASKLHYVANEIDSFKESGKKVYAVGDFFSQEQYLLASRADEIYMNDYGNVVLFGYGSYGLYLKSFLEKLKITTHVFRVGTFKSAVEPFIRDDMSPEAKEANMAFLSVLWSEYVGAITKARGIQGGAIENYANNLGDVLRGVNGDLGEAALQTKLVDGLKSRADIQKYLMQQIGADKQGKTYKNVGYKAYLSIAGKTEDDDDPNVAVVTAAGVIVDGEAPAGVAAGGDTIAKFLRQAREDENAKAVVLRVDSPGGSAFASDVIRDEVLALKEAGKPVVVSMGSLAASGGYWISAAADEIWASPTTITGSIGIFGYINTFENSAAEIGVHVDGVGTTQLSPLLATGVGPLPEEGADVIQQAVENGYDRFLNVVGEGRNLDRDYVDSVGQGRVWIGSTAKELKLVDQLGGYDDAVAAAAKLAKLESYDVVPVVETVSPFEKFMSSLSSRAMKAMGVSEQTARARQHGLRELLAKADEHVKFFEQFNDPNALYARCLACETN